MKRCDRWRAFSVLALIEFLTVMDASIVNIALPSIRESLGFSATDVAWVVGGYLIGLAGLMLVAGRVTDRVGRRFLFLTGVMVFAGVSVVCAAAVAPWHLVVGRIGQGLGQRWPCRQRSPSSPTCSLRALNATRRSASSVAWPG